MEGVLAIRKKELIDLTARVFVASQERSQSNATAIKDEGQKVAIKPLDISAMK
jgi:hypothetical protein